MAKVPRIRLSPFITRVAHALSILPAPAPAQAPGAASVPCAPAEAPRLVPGSVAWYFRHKRARQAFVLILRAMQERHRAQVRSDLRSKSYSNLTRYVIYMAFLESASYPVRPLDLPPGLGDWLQARADIEEGWYPADPCWQCGYRYPSSSDVAQAASLRSFTDTHIASQPAPFASSAPSRYPARRLCTNSPPLTPPHPWAGRHCLYCAGEIVNHLEWLDPKGKRTLTDFQKAPYREKHQSMAAQWRRELDAVKLDTPDSLDPLDSLAMGVAR
ncbi:MAG TPA: hypothetical protein VN345_20725 [Blastocatellia bacterium]|jgi:hypothetical protein|nr:hypothetical protein [Blastocatellia bacterium]